MGFVNDTINTIFGGDTKGAESARYAGDIQSAASREAAEKLAEGYRKSGEISSKGAQESYDIFNKLFQTGQGYLDPYQKAGNSALQKQQALLGLLGPEAQKAAYSEYSASPAQDYLLKQSEKAILRNASATGGLGGGAVLDALQQNATGIASQDFNNYLANIGALSSQGQNAAQFGAGYAMQGAGGLSNLNQAKANYLANAELGAADAYASGISNSAAARASGVIGAQQANAAMLNSLLGLGGQLGGSALLSDKNLKTDIRDLNPKKAYELVQKLPLKVWKYLKEVGIDEADHLGPMAQDAPSEIKVPGKEALRLHDELMLIAGALQHFKHLMTPKFQLVGRAF